MEKSCSGFCKTPKIANINPIPKFTQMFKKPPGHPELGDNQGWLGKGVERVRDPARVIGGEGPDPMHATGKFFTIWREAPEIFSALFLRGEKF